jgi:hypothetical protein
MTRYSKDEMLAEYDVTGFAYGLCMVKRKSDGVTGTFDFTKEPGEPREYHTFIEG